MSKKYKLIKEYPGSLKLGSIVSWQDDFYMDNSNEDNEFTKFYIEENPSYWEKIEKEYEILSFICKTAIKTFKESTYSNKHDWLKSFSNLVNWKIYSIRRLNDKEIFTIGDTIKCEYSNNVKIQRFVETKEYSITNLEIWHSSGVTVIRSYGSVFYNKNKFNQVIKIDKEKLFTTEDGIDVFEDDTIFVINKDTLDYLNIGKWTAQYLTTANLSIYYLAFSTKEKAEEYIINNKPCLSLIDILNTKIPNISENHWKKLRDLVESKLKL